MSSKNTILKGTLVLSLGEVAVYGLSFLRNMILARILSRSDFGIAATFALAISMLELTSRMALGRQIVQSKEGDSQNFLNSAHFFQFAAGGFSAVVLLCLCLPIAHIFKVPDKMWAFALIALVPLFRGSINLDFQRRQRQLNFLPSIWAEVIPQGLVTALSWPLAVWIGDFRVVLVLILGKEFLTAVMTHLVSQRPYRWAWDKKLSQAMWRFSWPLIINGLLLFAAQQGDQVLVGGGYSLEVLALYSAGATLVAVPFMMMATAASYIMLPLLSRVQDDMTHFIKNYQACVQISAVGAAISMIPLVVAGEQILKLVYGAKYAGGGGIMAWLAVACAFRFLRIAPATAAMAKADTKNNMVSNFFKPIGLLLGLAAVGIGAQVEVVAACMLFGELVALLVSTWLLKRRQSIPRIDTLKCAAYVAGCLSVTGGIAWLSGYLWSLALSVGVSGLLIFLAAAISWVLFHDNVSKLWRGVAGALFGGSGIFGFEKTTDK